MNLKEELIEFKKQIEKKYVFIYSDGTAQNHSDHDIEARTVWEPKNRFNYIKEEFKDAYERYGRKEMDVNSINMGLKVGVMFNDDDVIDFNTVKEGAIPVSSLVHFYTMDITGYSNATPVEDEIYNQTRIGHQTYIDYNVLVNQAEKEGIEYNGPKTFEELAQRIMDGQQIDINLFLDLRSSLTQEPEDVKVYVPSKVRKLFKK